MSAHWISRPHDPFLRTVGSSELVMSTGNAMLFALRLDCGHTVYAPCTPRSSTPPSRHRCKLCMQAAIGDKPMPRHLSPAEAAVSAYVGGAGGGVMAAAHVALMLRGAP